MTILTVFLLLNPSLNDQVSKKMPLSVEVPEINVTSEFEDDQDDHPLYNLSEALTDVEDLYEDDPQPVKAKSKLKIKLPVDDGAVTDLEDVEASSDESENVPLARHPVPVDLNQLDMEAPVSEESFTRKTSKKPQFATKQDSFYYSDEEDDLEDEGVETGFEDYETSEEVSEDIPDNEFDLDLYKTQDVVAEDANSRPTSPSLSSTSDSDKGATMLVVNHNQEGLTDVEVLGSDSESGRTSTRRRKRRPKKRYSIPYDSEDESEGELPFEVCKKVGLKVPDLEQDLQTDVEELEGDAEVFEVDESAMLELEEFSGAGASCVTSPTVKFSPSWPKLTNLKPPECEEPVTDCENLDSEGETSKIPAAFREIHNHTDVEDFSDDDLESEGSDLEAPPPSRNLVLIQENESQAPTIQIIPLDVEIEDRQNISAEATEEELLSEVEEGLEMPHNPGPAVLPVMEGGMVQVQDLVVRRRKRPPKFKAMFNSLKLKEVATTDSEDTMVSAEEDPQVVKGDCEV